MIFQNNALFTLLLAATTFANSNSNLFAMADHHHYLLQDDTNRPKQGVFLLSNQPNNQVGVYQSLSNGALSWVGAYSTGGVGYPDPNDERNLDDLGSSNAVHYHVWNDKQWILAANAGGPQGDTSVSLMQVHPTTLELTLLHKADLQGTFACSVAAFEDRVCVATCAGSVTMECFRITDNAPNTPSSSSSYELVPDFVHDFEANIPHPSGRPAATSAAFGPGNILFSGDGLQVGIVMKGDADLDTQYRLNGFSAPHAGFVAFPVRSDGYGSPITYKLPNESLPFAFVWRSGQVDTNKQIVLIANVAGENQDFPQCEECRSSVTTLETNILPDDSLAVRFVDEINLNVIDGCWIDYRFSHFYTGNFASDTISIGTVSREGVLSAERNVPVGKDTLPNDVVHMGRKLDGSFYLYSENQGVREIGVNRLVENESFQLEVKAGAPMPSGDRMDAWDGANGLAATTLSEMELYVMYGYGSDHEEDEDEDDEDNEGVGNATPQGTANGPGRRNLRRQG